MRGIYQRLGFSILVSGALLASLSPGKASAALPDNGIHPAFDIKEVPLPDKYRTMGIDFLSDGRMVIATAVSGISCFLMRSRRPMGWVWMSKTLRPSAG